ncbi:hypothetical protein COX26_01470 [Candidatus Jorgensenbacteria bacterium CG23_combo_of_CG06-09_8_20_14_all_54_14]|uniref:Uncharacterized protein n=1 Tax=Candidatus Jorgensenbacteria bacterium CG23_combo_of_CG06-09_8_20_14_all_54_14 TaxID=1974595 RepID=A0A2G9Z9V6_9BACT|nr:MAG: hypothetical protein COX26_01470 [Candidatus Jorgensenbacteria bacterium CG23_combo_of_CG06-09_8_20_14_all_54_14]
MKRFRRIGVAAKTVAEVGAIKAEVASAFIFQMAANLLFSPVQAVLVLEYFQTFRALLSSRFAAFMRLFSP